MLHAAILQRIKGCRTAVGVIDDLIRRRQHAGLHVRADAANRCHAQNLVDALRVQGPDVGTIIHLVRRYRVSIAMARQENQFPSGDLADGQRARRLAVGRAHREAMLDREVRQLRQSAAADNCKHVISFVLVRRAVYSACPGLMA